MIDKLVRPELQSFKAYNANQIPYRIKLDANESPYDIPMSVKRKLADYFLADPGLNLYPDTDSVQLRKALADYWEADMEGIVVGTGSDQLIDVLVKVFAGPGDKVIYPGPSFVMYRLNTVIAGATPVEIPLCNDFSYPINEFISTANREQAKIVFLCTPNNPTGDTIPMEDIIKVIEGCNQSIVVVDEAYAEFSGETVIPLVSKYQNLVVLRTFSKAYGLAGIRCGYSVSGKAIAREMDKIRPPYNISSISQLAARLVFEERAVTEMQIDEIIQQRNYVVSQLGTMGKVRVYPSKANFLLVKFEDGEYVNGELVKRGIMVRSYGKSAMLENCLRITIGTREQNLALLEAINEILDK